MLRWFNLQSISPSLSACTASSVFLRAETLQAKTKEKLLLESHPTARLASKFLLRMVSVPVSDSATFASVKPLLHERRVDFLEFSSTRLMLWSYTRWVAVGALQPWRCR